MSSRFKQFQPEFDDSRGHHGNSTKVTSPGLDIGSGHCRDDCFWFFVPLLRHHCIIEIFSNQLPNWLSPCWGIRWTFLAHPLTPSHMLQGLWNDCSSIQFMPIQFKSIRFNAIPEAGDIVVEHLRALLLLEQVRGQKSQLHDHPCQPCGDFSLQEEETSL